MLNNTKIGAKLIGGFIIVLVLMVVIGAMGIYGLSSVIKENSEAYENQTKASLSIQDAALDFALLRIAIRSSILYSDPADIETQLQKVETYKTAFYQAVDEYGKRADVSEETKFNQMKTDFESYMAGATKVLALARTGQDEAAFEALMAIQTPGDATIKAIDELVATEITSVEQEQEYVQGLYSQLTAIILGVMIVAILGALVIAIGLTRHITSPLSQTVSMIQELGQGHLDGRLSLKRGDEVGILANAMDALANDLQNTVVRAMRKISDGDLNIEVSPKDNRDEISPALIQTIESLRGLVAETHMLTNAAAEKRLNARGDVKRFKGVYGEIVKGVNDTLEAMSAPVKLIAETASNLGSAASEILAATTQQLSGATEQSAAVSQTTTTVDEVKALSDQAVERSQEVVSASQKAAEISQSGTRTVTETVESMGHIKERVEGIAENIVALSERTQQIGEIITTVNEIATQSNMLALNASVEASRAGEYGKGFAAVAGEVRSLAEQSRQSTVQVRTILQDVQNAINAAVMATEEGTKVVDTGVKLAAQTGEAISQLASAIQQSAQTAAQVMAGGRQQASGVEQVAVAMRNINQVTQQSLASSRQVEKAAQDLNAMSGKLGDLVKQYQV
ncbi:MAG TPA: methyl-accepting chemotaxis protein [Anaerolineales bacterium]|nr:methyl-accepting chemotaxis protein [Anaerolineales bacterium]